MTFRIPLSIHAGLETLAGPAIMAAPFVLGFGQAATVICLIVGVLLLTFALQLPGPSRSIPLSSHQSFDYGLALFATVSGFALGLIAGAWAPAAFLVATGIGIVALTASTRFSSPLGA